VAGPDLRRANIVTSHSHVWRRERGFTLVELITVMVLIGIIGAIGAARFFDRASFDAPAFADQTRAMLRYAQKVAIARNEAVFVRFDGNSAALCLTAAAPCPSAQQVRAPSGSNSDSSATRAACGSSTWMCEAAPPDVTYLLEPAIRHFSFDSLGRPVSVAGQPAFAGLAVTVSGDGAARTINIAPETGYVF
jgi:MSHA pilin protein MshC